MLSISLVFPRKMGLWGNLSNRFINHNTFPRLSNYKIKRDTEQLYLQPRICTIKWRHNWRPKVIWELHMTSGRWMIRVSISKACIKMLKTHSKNSRDHWVLNFFTTAISGCNQDKEANLKLSLQRQQRKVHFILVGTKIIDYIEIAWEWAWATNQSSLIKKFI